ncbi:acyl carrier protein [Catelliglobosispora koreensis]|uniref:phosphopantetheine-binding protein n=1 Tax=Catelliglobosispora koreensis TaxID=129052 RepID=UPI0003A44EB9|nr:phosphopantetheine-binding protein [Catelliglobosispora koreensis]
MPEQEQRVTARTEAEIREHVQELIKSLAPEKTVPVVAEARLVEELGYHSLALIELSFLLEDEFNLPPIDEESARAITTVSLVEQHVIDTLARKGVLA